MDWLQPAGPPADPHQSERGAAAAGRLRYRRLPRRREAVRAGGAGPPCGRAGDCRGGAGSGAAAAAGARWPAGEGGGDGGGTLQEPAGRRPCLRQGVRRRVSRRAGARPRWLRRARPPRGRRGTAARGRHGAARPAGGHGGVARHDGHRFLPGAPSLVRCSGLKKVPVPAAAALQHVALLDRLADTAGPLGTMATVSCYVHRPWYVALAEEGAARRCSTGWHTRRRRPEKKGADLYIYVYVYTHSITVEVPDFPRPVIPTPSGEGCRASYMMRVEKMYYYLVMINNVRHEPDVINEKSLTVRVPSSNLEVCDTFPPLPFPTKRLGQSRPGT